jgi:hypothetical protein
MNVGFLGNFLSGLDTCVYLRVNEHELRKKYKGK